MRYYDRYKGLSRTSRNTFWVVLGLMILVGVCAFFTSDLGRNITMVCCGGLLLLVVVGLISESGMRRPG